MNNRSGILVVLPVVVSLLVACGGSDNDPQPAPLICEDRATGVTVFQEDKCDSGYTLLASLGGHENPDGSRRYHGALLIDMDGTLVHEWKIASIPAKMLPDGHVLGFHFTRDDGTIHQDMDYLVEMDWNGNEIWRWDQWDVDARGHPISRGHHDFQREGFPEGYYVAGASPYTTSGRTLLLVHDTVERPDIAPWPLEDDAILELDAEGNVLWEWHASDHLEEFGFSAAARAAMQHIQVFLPPDALSRGVGVTDWLHTNTVNYLGPNRWWDGGDGRFNPENVMAASRNANILWIIEKSTGKIVWKVGPDYSPGRPEHRLGQIIGAHHPHMIAKGLPGEGNVLVFDNGGLAGYGRLFEVFGPPLFPNKSRWYSRVIEFDPVSLDVVWDYSRRFPLPGENYPFFSIYVSGAQRLPNGNTLITEGDTARIFEVTASGELVWEYLSPYHDYFYDALPDPGQRCQADIYRAYRIPYDYIPEELLP